MINWFQYLCFHSRGQYLCKFIGTKESVYISKDVQLPQDWFGTQIWLNMAAVSLFWDTNMAAMTSCENTQDKVDSAKPGPGLQYS